MVLSCSLTVTLSEGGWPGAKLRGYLKIDTGADVVNEPLEQESNSVDDLAHLVIGVKISSGKKPDYSSDLRTE
jgi:hypothetical protein